MTRNLHSISRFLTAIIFCVTVQHIADIGEHLGTAAGVVTRVDEIGNSLRLAPHVTSSLHRLPSGNNDFISLKLQEEVIR